MKKTILTVLLLTIGLAGLSAQTVIRAQLIGQNVITGEDAFAIRNGVSSDETLWTGSDADYLWNFALRYIENNYRCSNKDVYRITVTYRNVTFAIYAWLNLSSGEWVGNIYKVN